MRQELTNDDWCSRYIISKRTRTHTRAKRKCRGNLTAHLNMDKCQTISQMRFVLHYSANVLVCHLCSARCRVIATRIAIFPFFIPPKSDDGFLLRPNNMSLRSSRFRALAEHSRPWLSVSMTKSILRPLILSVYIRYMRDTANSSISISIKIPNLFST